MRKYTLLTLFLLCFFASCEKKKPIVEGEHIFRKKDETFFAPLPSYRRESPVYPWHERKVGGCTPITKEHFRCRGCILNGATTYKARTFWDCVGGAKHSLPLKGGNEFVYPCLIDLLNFIQERCQKKVVITCGHRCPTHNAFSDPTPYNFGSKHMIGAEVDFYVEETPIEEVLEALFTYYDNATFDRFSAEKLNVSTDAWYNKEVLVKLYKEDEGRDFDNNHPLPYLGVQVRFDRESGNRVVFKHELAENYLRF